jgi:hypothetical protein
VGFYIETPCNVGKDDYLVHFEGAERVTSPIFEDTPAGKVLVCVVANGPFDAVGICYDRAEFDVFTQPDDYRPKKWLYMDRGRVIALNPHVASRL